MRLEERKNRCELALPDSLNLLGFAFPEDGLEQSSSSDDNSSDEEKELAKRMETATLSFNKLEAQEKLEIVIEKREQRRKSCFLEEPDSATMRNKIT